MLALRDRITQCDRAEPRSRADRSTGRTSCELLHTLRPISTSRHIVRSSRVRSRVHQSWIGSSWVS